MPRSRNFTVYHFLKASEGGPDGGRRGMLAVLKVNGIVAEAHPSPYVGHVAVKVYGGKRVQTKAHRIILG